MVYKIMMGAVSALFAVFAYNSSGLENPYKTLFGAMFIGLALAVFLDIGEENETRTEDE